MQVVNALQEGATDLRVKGVLALIGGTQQFTGLAQVQEIRKAMQEFRQAHAVVDGFVCHDSVDSQCAFELNPFFVMPTIYLQHCHCTVIEWIPFWFHAASFAGRGASTTMDVENAHMGAPALTQAHSSRAPLPPA